MLYVEKVNFALLAGAFVMSALDVSTLSFFVSFAEALEYFINRFYGPLHKLGVISNHSYKK